MSVTKICIKYRKHGPCNLDTKTLLFFVPIQPYFPSFRPCLLPCGNLQFSLSQTIKKVRADKAVFGSTENFFN